MSKYSYVEKQTKNRKKILIWLAAIILLVVAVFCGIMALFEYSNLQKDKMAISEMSEWVHKDEKLQLTKKSENHINEKYAKLKKQNSDFYGWIQIKGTPVDYPVMHTPKIPEKYLHRNFKDEYSFSGLPFIDARCTDSSDNLIVYAHNMNNGSMFASIIKYKDKSYFKKHPIITLNTVDENREYEVFAAFYDRVYKAGEEHFKFYDFIDAKNEQEYDDAVKYYKDNSVFDTNITPHYGEQIITLSTCSYHTTDGRFVVVARKKSK